MIRLNEDLFEDVFTLEIPEDEQEETIPPGPLPGEDTGLTDLILDAINDENETIRKYNILVANLGEHGNFKEVIDDILHEENLHVGQLQTLLKKLSPNAEDIAQGEIEADKQLKEDLDTDSISISEQSSISIDDLKNVETELKTKLGEDILLKEFINHTPVDMLYQFYNELAKKYNIELSSFRSLKLDTEQVQIEED